LYDIDELTMGAKDAKFVFVFVCFYL